MPFTNLSLSFKRDSILRKIFRTLSTIFSKSIQTSALRALRLVTQLAISDISVASYELFKTIMASNDLTDQHWEAARLAVDKAFRGNSGPRLELGEPEGMLKFLVYHLGLSGAPEGHRSSITLAFEKVFWPSRYPPNPPIVECIRNSSCASPSFVRGVRSIMRPGNSLGLQKGATSLVSLASDQWFNSTVPIMTPEEMSEFCEHLAVFVVDGHDRGPSIMGSGVTILFGMLRSSEWRKHIVTRLWSVLAHCCLVEEEISFRWCLQHAIELLDFTRGLPNSQGLKWWYATLRFYYDKLDPTVRDEVKRIARVIPRRGYLSRIKRETTKIRRSYQRRGYSDVSSESDGSSESDESGDSDVESRNRSSRNIYSIYSPPVDRRDWHVRVRE